MRIMSLMILAALWLTTTVSLSGQELEKFRLKNGSEPIEARPVAWDFETGVLTLETADGTTLEVAASELHAADGRLIERVLRKQILAGQKNEPARTSSNRTTNSRNVVSNSRNDQADILHGVKWHSDKTLAGKLASGDEGVRDDKPIVWFRVLGDLTGLM